MAVARSGAMTVGEVAAMGLPALLIPLPTATHGHQEMNARQLAEAGAARMILQSDLSGASLAKSLLEMNADRSQLAEMSRRAQHTITSNGAGKVNELCRKTAQAA
ncbi:MAG: UDP-N-acetylglucosamine--N-acetylmuramyl-(pentapeptide) pyrophosphoryl-undecaprenol N-acetylglucosamine transferase, partial [Nitrospinaceae bacterium]|nr:UDP-N-acetylglucosamine--N-acetylmuramyl-(pentapeptide) pyrophosphoryl-undecaprenol N-acetylglucosamine transferase [Nitrospinaceae bacterium]